MGEHLNAHVSVALTVGCVERSWVICTDLCRLGLHMCGSDSCMHMAMLHEYGMYVLMACDMACTWGHRMRVAAEMRTFGDDGAMDWRMGCLWIG